VVGAAPRLVNYNQPVPMRVPGLQCHEMLHTSGGKLVADALLVINAGSSSLKFQVFDVQPDRTPQMRCGGQIGGVGSVAPVFKVKAASGTVLVNNTLSPSQAASLPAAQDMLAQWLATQLSQAPCAVGHRIVHGGARHNGPVLINDDVVQELQALVPLAPLHQRNNLEPVRVIRERWPHIPQVACFDTAFHRTHNPLMDHFALPAAYYQQGVRRYGFHGLSYDYIAGYLQQHHPDLAAGRVVVAHLGSGASACAMHNGKSVDTTMGFTALDGLPMGTRPGSLDPGVVLWMAEQGMNAQQIQHVLYYESGLKGLSGISGDIRELLCSDSPLAKMALDYFAYRAAVCLAGLVVPLQGLDALVFTAGIGEHAAPVRASICAHLQHLGVRLSSQANQANDKVISSDDSAVQVLVVPTNEELVIARQALACLRETCQTANP
jgi:acetate kinase